GILLLPCRRITPRDDLLVVLVLAQLEALLVGEVQDIAFVRQYAPFLRIIRVPGTPLKSMNVLPTRPPIRGRRQLQDARAVLHGDDILDAALAIGPLAHDDGPAVILQACRDDLAGAGAHAVDEANHREIEVAVLVLTILGVFRAGASPRLDRNDQAVV